jgi:hypothetical protein
MACTLIATPGEHNGTNNLLRNSLLASETTYPPVYTNSKLFLTRTL